MVDPRAVSSLVSLAGRPPFNFQFPLVSSQVQKDVGKSVAVAFASSATRKTYSRNLSPALPSSQTTSPFSPARAPSPGLIISRDSTRNSDSGSGDYPEGKQSRSLLWIVQFLFSSRPLSRSYNRPTDRPQTEVERATNMNMAWKEEARKAAALFVKPPSRPVPHSLSPSRRSFGAINIPLLLSAA